jgi:hypothetical protein
MSKNLSTLTFDRSYDEFFYLVLESIKVFPGAYLIKRDFVNGKIVYGTPSSMWSYGAKISFHIQKQETGQGVSVNSEISRFGLVDYGMNQKDQNKIIDFLNSNLETKIAISEEEKHLMVSLYDLHATAPDFSFTDYLILIGGSLCFSPIIGFFVYIYLRNSNPKKASKALNTYLITMFLYFGIIFGCVIFTLLISALTK